MILCFRMERLNESGGQLLISFCRCLSLQPGGVIDLNLERLLSALSTFAKQPCSSDHLELNLRGEYGTI